MKDEMWIEAVGGAHCNDCRFYSGPPENDDDEVGICVRYPHWEERRTYDWCGEFELEPSRRRAFEAEWVERWNGRLK
jgi:hypothetical protein